MPRLAARLAALRPGGGGSGGLRLTRALLAQEYDVARPALACPACVEAAVVALAAEAAAAPPGAAPPLAGARSA